MKKLAIWIIIMYLGAGIMGLGFLTGLGIAIYDLAQDVAAGQALWHGFVTWIKMLIVGFVLWIAGVAGVFNKS